MNFMPRLMPYRIILPFKALGGQGCPGGTTLAAWEMLGRKQYAANAGLARGGSACPASTQKYRGGAQCVVPCVSLSQQICCRQWEFFHFGGLQQRGDQAYRQRTHDYDSIHESFLSKSAE